MTYSAVNFLSHVCRPNERNCYIEQNSEQQGERLVGNVRKAGKLRMWGQRQSFHQGFYDISWCSTLSTLLIWAPSTLDSLPSTTLASWQFFKHTRHIRGSRFCTCCSLAWNPVHPYIQELLLLLSSLNSSVTKAILDISVCHTTQRDTPDPLYSDYSPVHMLLFDLSTCVHLLTFVYSNRNVNSKAEIFLTSTW